eukprot:1438122-Prymnesium_polylepis.3
MHSSALEGWCMLASSDLSPKARAETGLPSVCVQKCRCAEVRSSSVSTSVVPQIVPAMPTGIAPCEDA